MAAFITLTGGSPWGFKMVGGKDFRLPLTIGKVLPGGKAAKHGVMEGYVIEGVNGEDATNMSHHEAQNRIKTAGFRLTLNLSKPKPRSIPEDSNPSGLIKKAAIASLQSEAYKPTQNWTPYPQEQYQNNHTVAQSPALFVKTQPPKETTSNGIKPSMVITREIKDMIIDDDAGKMKAGSIKVWRPQPQTAPNDRKSSWNSNRSSDESLERTRAANNIGKFFQSSAAPRYGEPTFAKALHDMAAPLGEPVVLEIRLGPDLPVPTVHWYHDNRPARESVQKDVRMLSNGPIHTLVLGELTPELLGGYTCTIMNKYGSKSSRCDVTAAEEKSHSQSSSVDLSNSVTTRSTPSNSIPSRRVVASTSIDLYSSNNIQETFHSRVNQHTPRSSFDDSEVMKMIRDDSPRRYHRKTPSMKHLEETLLPESDSL